MLKNIYNQTITILNKFKGSDSESKLDTWYKTELHDAAWYSKSQRTVSGNTVLIGSYTKCLIPRHSEFLPYSEWKQLTDKSNNYTMSVGDYIVLGKVPEEITANTVVKLMGEYEPNVCSVKHFEVAHDRFGSYVQLDVEGV